MYCGGERGVVSLFTVLKGRLRVCDPTLVVAVLAISVESDDVDGVDDTVEVEVMVLKEEAECC